MMTHDDTLRRRDDNKKTIFLKLSTKPSNMISKGTMHHLAKF